MKNAGGIEGLIVFEPRLIKDEYGDCYIETYNKNEFWKSGLNVDFIQDNEVYSKKNVLRGFHVNYKNPQVKLVRVIEGAVYDVVIDLRKNSPTYKKWYGIRLSAENKKQLYIPAEFAHGYLALENSRVLYKTTTHWKAGEEIGFAWNSQDFNIDWPLEKPVLSESDSNNCIFSEIDVFRR